MGKTLKRILISVAVVFLSLVVIGFVTEAITVKSGSVNEFESAVKSKKIESVTYLEDKGQLLYKSEDKYYKTQVLRNYFEIKPDILEVLKKNKVDLKIEKSKDATSFIVSVVYVLFLIIIITYGYKMLKSFINTDLEEINNIKTKFDDVGGLDNVKKELNSLIAYLKEPEKIREYVDKTPKGILFEGDPGNGKTLLARAIAGESETPFYYISGADIEGSFVAQGAGRVGSIFKKVRKAAEEKGKAILFIDELDSIGVKREKRTVTETNQTLNKILTELDGFNENENILVIGATNLASQLDSALVRSGRFDRIIKIPMPGTSDRKNVLDLYLSKKEDILDSKVKEMDYIEVLAKQTEGFSGADLERLVNDAALLAFEEGGKIKINNLRESYLRIVMGLPNDEPVSYENQKILAYHESAHAVIAMATSKLGVRSVSYGTILPYGNAGGHVSIIDSPSILVKKTDIYNTLKRLLAGRAVEDRILEGDFTTGASNDLMKVNSIIYKYITEYGMSSDDTNLYVDSNLIESNSPWIQNEVKKIREEVYRNTVDIVNENYDSIVELAEYLLEHKEIDQDVLIELFESKYPTLV